ncbi:hypothetical protein KPSA1_04614 [Pseudomonas syringae pv. actinidiae]|uniref:Uncharacterized protein n=1 Tax=Pseudomonas syringae pv. actinidiae TaxID=103796 RepID=A0A2V0QKQ0_PSESF|nr:hypothetical protein KPSA1_04614 [Pseudomonas syringae pv. actinidiae]
MRGCQIIRHYIIFARKYAVTLRKTDSHHLPPLQSPPLSQRLEPDLPCQFCVYRFFLPLQANNTGAIFPVPH